MSARRDLTRLFSPQSVAIVGASGNPAAVGGQPIAYLQQKGFPGPIYPVNPRHETVAGLRCYPDLAALPAARRRVIGVLVGDRRYRRGPVDGSS